MDYPPFIFRKLTGEGLYEGVHAEHLRRSLLVGIAPPHARIARIRARVHASS